MTTSTAHHGTSRSTLAQAAHWHLIELLLSRPREDWLARIRSLVREVSDPELVRAVEAAAADATQEIYDTTFGPGGPAAPREVSYRESLDAGAFLSDLCAVYRVFGYEPPGTEPPDHVAIEAGFVGYLYLKQHFADCRGQFEQRDLAAAARRDFLADHLAVLAGPLAKSLEHSGIEYLASAGRALRRRAGTARSAGGSQTALGVALAVVPDEGCVFDKELYDGE